MKASRATTRRLEGGDGDGMKSGQGTALVLALILLIASFYIFHARGLETRAREMETFKRLSGMSVYSINGNRASIGALISGRPSALIFVAPTCGHCQAELSTLDLLSEVTPKNVNVIVVADAAHHGEENLRKFAAEHQAVQMYFDRDQIRQDLHLRFVPSILCLDRKGSVRQVVFGERSIDFLANTLRDLSML